MRQLFEYAKMAFRNITGNKMRTLLTMLGIIIGIAAVIIVLCIGSGGQKAIDQQLSGIANGSVYLMASGEDATNSDYFTDMDLDAVRQIPGVAAVSMTVSASGTARGTREDVRVNVSGGNGDMHVIQPPTLIRGRMLDEADYVGARQVCTVDSAGAKELFGSDNVLGMSISLSLGEKTVSFTIVGITESTQMSFGGSVTAEIAAPASSLAAISNAAAAPYMRLALLASDPQNSAQVGQQVLSQIELRHGNGGRDIYSVLDVSQYLSQINTVTSLFTTIIAAIAGISLLVGGIGVMNIMLVSVTERTREIGIRKALGAKTRTILFQFLVESAALTLLGGIIGIVLGLWGGAAVGSLIDIEASIGMDMVLYIALFSSAIGIFFGIYPARKAARLNPIEALRSE